MPNLQADLQAWPIFSGPLTLLPPCCDSFQSSLWLTGLEALLALWLSWVWSDPVRIDHKWLNPDCPVRMPPVPGAVPELRSPALHDSSCLVPLSFLFPQGLLPVGWRIYLHSLLFFF